MQKCAHWGPFRKCCYARDSHDCSNQPSQTSHTPFSTCSCPPRRHYDAQTQNVPPHYPSYNTQPSQEMYASPHHSISCKRQHGSHPIQTNLNFLVQHRKTHEIPLDHHLIMTCASMSTPLYITRSSNAFVLNKLPQIHKEPKCLQW